MSQLAIGTYIDVLTRGMDSRLSVQNFFYDSAPGGYVFGAFGFSGATVDVSGASISATLVFAHSQLLLNLMRQACDERWLMRVKTVWLEPDTYAETNVFSEELYAILSYEHDLTRVQIRLGSPLDAIAAQIPRRTLNRWIVGNLPATSTLNLR